MQIRIGTTLLNIGEAYPAFWGSRRLYNQRGKAQAIVKRMDIRGEIIASGQAAINTRIGQIMAALQVENQSVVFLNDAGAETHIQLPSSGARYIRCVEHTFTEEEAKGHFATGHPFSMAFEAEYLVSDNDPYVFYEETVTRIGNGGSRTVIQELDNGAPVEQTVSTNTPSLIIQQGSALGATYYPPFPTPIYGVDNPEESLTYGSPDVNGVSWINWPIRWSYRKTLTTAPQLSGPNFPG